VAVSHCLGDLTILRAACTPPRLLVRLPVCLYASPSAPRHPSQITISYMPLGVIGAARPASLREHHSFVCRCERCAAVVGTPLYDAEQSQMALACEAVTSAALAATDHGLVPENPYDSTTSYRCREAGCTCTLTSAQADQRLAAVRNAFRALHANCAKIPPGDAEAAVRACAAAREAWLAASRVLMPQHHEWMVWTTAAMALADMAGDDELYLRACMQREKATVASRVEDADVFVRVQHALVLGLDDAKGARMLEAAYSLDRASCGCGIEGFLARWLPADLVEAGVAADARRLLQTPKRPVP